MGELVVALVPNRGRDVAPFVAHFAARLQTYTYVAHVHSKKSLYNRGATGNWRSYLLDALFGSSKRIMQIMTLLDKESGFGLVFPQMHDRLPVWAATWLASRDRGRELLYKMGISLFPQDYFDFPVGTMFWARADALRPLFALGLTTEDFDPEEGQQDGTLAHALERVIGIVPRSCGVDLAVLREHKNTHACRWGFDHMEAQLAAFDAALANQDVRLILFDIFDTLLIRPLLHPDDTKRVVAARLTDAALRRAFTQYRHEAEHRARLETGRDVGLEAIYAMFGQISGCDAGQCATIRALEEEVEKKCRTPAPRPCAAVFAGEKIRQTGLLCQRHVFAAKRVGRNAAPVRY